MSLKKKLTFEELVQENRQQILKDHLLMEKIELNLESRMHQSVRKIEEKKIN
ncbi:FbpB family small basic protein [Virgibacillus profundi]|uniref:FbpB family small basic protein n=1 Tax=Virgibacillus profundi TaxID=2024555 RepID=A0A2A2IDN6_9BACI|nr:FbpB family small basic protein [Virgibacillus profundi]PAV29384.1 FbpB family small basic protein [Virgibacillus profundi]PXY53554.1 FbpB family small basic protein [Virgibacillus profundi]